jgi:hypothetical protein
MLCNGQASVDTNTSLVLWAIYVKEYIAPGADDGSDDDEGLTSEGVAGIVVACVVAFLFLVGLFFSLKGTQWFQTTFKCRFCKNKTSNLPGNNEQSRNEDIERRETGLAGSAGDPISHQPSNPVSIQPPAKTQTVAAVTHVEHDVMGVSSVHELN